MKVDLEIVVKRVQTGRALSRDPKGVPTLLQGVSRQQCFVKLVRERVGGEPIGAD